MLPNFLYSTYKKYKDDTSIFIKWLADTAKKCGHAVKETTESKSEGTSAKTPRLTGKARKQAKQESSNKPDHVAPNVPKESRHLVDYEDLLPSAKAIANFKDPTVKIPSEIIRAALRAVSARNRFTAYFRSKTKAGENEMARDNDRHSYFIALMEEVLLTLQPCFAVSAGDATGEDRQPSSTLEDLENRFAILEVEEPVEQEGDDAMGSAALSPTQPIYDLEIPKVEKDMEEEKLFAIFCLFEDLGRLRTYLSRVWVEYKLGIVDLITASVTTNTAFQLAIRTQEELLVNYPQLGDYQNVLSTVMGLVAKDQGGDETLELEVDDHIAEWLFAPAHSLLDSFCDVLDSRQVPLMKRGHFGVYNPRTVRSKLNDVQKHQEDLVLLIELLPEFCFIAKYKIHLFATDELTRGLCKMALTTEIPVWLTFATTVFLDIHHFLREKVDKGFEELRTIGSHATSTLDKHFELSQGLRTPSTWPKQNQEILRMLAKEIQEFTLRDQIFPIKDRQYKKLDSTFASESERFYLYKRQPILCGILAFKTILEMQHAGVSLCNAWGTVIYPAHLYNALRRKTKPIEPWPLMEQVISLHSESRVFIGAQPKTIGDCFKQVCLMLGYSAEQYARNRRKLKPVISKNGPRGLKDTSPLGELFRDGLANNGSMALTVLNVENLFNEQARDTALASNPQSKTLRREWRTTRQLTSLQLLEALRASIPMELPKLKFNYFHMHEQSITLLRRLKTELDPDMRKFFGPMYLENESQLPFLGPYIIMAACGTEKVAEQLKIDGAGSALLEKAGRVVEDFVREQE